LLSAISLGCTLKTLAGISPRKHLLAALALSVFASYCLIEGAVALEPARFFIILFCLRKKHADIQTACRKAVKIWLPFAVALIPIAVYKYCCKPYGIYSGIYNQSFRNFLEPQAYHFLCRHFSLWNWRLLWRFVDGVPTHALACGAAATGLAVCFLTRTRMTSEAPPVPIAASDPNRRFLDVSPEERHAAIFFFGLLLFFFPAALYLYTYRVPGISFESRHGIILQLGFPAMLGSAIFWLQGLMRQGQAFRLLAALFIGGGVFFNNVNIDQFSKAKAFKQEFWTAFARRFPSLPEQSDFLFDVTRDSLLYFVSSHNEFELPLNMLYATSTDPAKFRAHRALVPDEWPRDGRKHFRRPSLYADDAFDAARIIAVYYWDKELLINEEILARCHPPFKQEILARCHQPYSALFKKPFPNLPAQPRPYLLRHKLAQYLPLEKG